MAWGFSAPPRVRWAGWDRPSRVVLEERVLYEARDGEQYLIPIGMSTDLASVPAVFPGVVRWLLADGLSSGAAAILHARLYSTREVTRAHADALLAESLRWLHRERRSTLQPWRRRSAAIRDRVAECAYWLGVRVGGRRAWARHRGRGGRADE